MAKTSNSRPRMLLHVCCGTCALYPYFKLKRDFNITFFYYNPNIYPKEEYLRRLDGVQTIAKKYSVPLITGRYEIKKWLALTKGLKDEPEGGKRCHLCFRIRLVEAAKQAKKLGSDLFGTTLTVSPLKNHNVINSLGSDIAASLGIDFFQSNFKKNDGFKKTIKMSKKIKLYRQNYCGCIYSMR
jgi:predicted adenine nucleotide alpha hydrolase (AANH) superfamily ATPase